MVCGVGSGQTSWCIACRTQVRSEELRKKKKALMGRSGELTPKEDMGSLGSKCRGWKLHRREL